MDNRKDTAPAVVADVATVYVAIELSMKNWLAALQSPRQERASRHKQAPETRRQPSVAVQPPEQRVRIEQEAQRLSGPRRPTPPAAAARRTPCPDGRQIALAGSLYVLYLWQEH